MRFRPCLHRHWAFGAGVILLGLARAALADPATQIAGPTEEATGMTPYHWFQVGMAVVTILPFFGLFIKKLAHSYRYATFMASWSASTLFWVFWLLEKLNTFDYFISIAITCFFPILWFYRTRMRQ